MGTNVVAHNDRANVAIKGEGLTVTGTGSLKAIASATTGSGIMANALTVNGGFVTAYGAAYGIEASPLTIKNGATVTATGTAENSDGVYGSLVMDEGGKLTAMGNFGAIAAESKDYYSTEDEAKTAAQNLIQLPEGYLRKNKIKTIADQFSGDQSSASDLWVAIADIVDEKDVRVKEITLPEQVTTTLTTKDGFQYTIEGDSVTITGYTGEANHLVIPAEIDGKTVTTLGHMAFKDNNTISSVEIPACVTTIDARAFFRVKYLKTVTFAPGSKLTKIGTQAFQDTLLTGLTIPEGVNHIYGYAFKNCKNIETMVIPAAVKEIGEHAFDNCVKLHTITFQSTTAPGLFRDTTFTGCTALTTINVPNGATGYTTENGWPETKVVEQETTTQPQETETLPVKVSPAVKAQSVSIKAISKKLAAGRKVQMTPVVAPANTTNKTVTWSSSNTKYATVDAVGKVSFKKAGAGKSVTITATAADGSGRAGSVKIKIMKHAVKSVKLKAAKTVKAGKKVKVKATVKTTGKKVNKKLQWTSSNTNYATVSSKGVVKTKKAGKGKTVKITAASTDGTNKKKTVKIKIK